MNTKAFFPCGGGSNLILGTGRKNQTIIFNTCISFEKKKLEWKNFYRKKNLSEKKLVGKTIFVRRIIGKKFYQKKNYWKIFLSESGGCDKCDLIYIFVYQMGRLCGGAHEISDIKVPLFLHGWWCGWCDGKKWGEWWVGGGGDGGVC